jgi:hypothetical protein
VQQNDRDDDAAAADDDDDDDDDDGELLLSQWVQKVDCGILGRYDYDAYAARESDIVTAETQTDKETVRDMRSKDGKEVEELEEKIGRRKKVKKLRCHFPFWVRLLEEL